MIRTYLSSYGHTQLLRSPDVVVDRIIPIFDVCHCHFQFRKTPEVAMNTALLSADVTSPNQMPDSGNHAQEREWTFSPWKRSRTFSN